jgi:hypothetical protein
MQFNSIFKYLLIQVSLKDISTTAEPMNIDYHVLNKVIHLDSIIIT